MSHPKSVILFCEDCSPPQKKQKQQQKQNNYLKKSTFPQMVGLLICFYLVVGDFSEKKNIVLFPLSSLTLFLHCTFRVEKHTLTSLIHTAHGPPAELTLDYSWLLFSPSLAFAKMFSDSEWILLSSCILGICWGLENYTGKRTCNILCFVLHLGNDSYRLWHIKWGTGNGWLNAIS